MSTPEEQIAHKIEVQGSKWQKTPDGHFYMQKAIRKAMKLLQDRRVQTSHHPPALSSLADRLWKTTATCAVMIVASSLGEDTNNRVSRNWNKLVLTPEALWWGPARHAGLWSSGKCRQRAETTDSSKPSHGGLSCSCGHSNLCGSFCSFDGTWLRK